MDTDLWLCDCGRVHVGSGPHRRIRRLIRRIWTAVTR